MTPDNKQRQTKEKQRIEKGIENNNKTTAKKQTMEMSANRKQCRRPCCLIELELHCNQIVNFTAPEF